MLKFRQAMFFVAFIASSISFHLATKIDRSPIGAPMRDIDNGADGGAAGFAILGSMALIAASVTFLKDEDKQ